MNEYELDTAIKTIRDWLFQYNDADRESIIKARWALHIALEAKEHYEDKRDDEFVQNVIQYICGA